MAGEPSSFATAALASLAAAGVATTVSIGLSSAGIRRGEEGPVKGDGDGFLWGLASFLSLIPLANWTAWLLLAQELKQDTEKQEQKDGSGSMGTRGSSSGNALYYAFAAIYALPLLQGGLPPRAPDFLLLAIGAVHIQLERVSVTEPEVLLRALPPGQAESAGALGEAVTRALMGAGSLGKAALVDKGEAQQGAQDPAASAELKAFDEKLGVKKQQVEKAIEDDDDLGWG